MSILAIIGIASAATGLASLIFGAAHQRKAANTLKDIHSTLEATRRGQ